MQCALTVLCGAFFAVLLLFRVNPSSQIDAIWPLKANCTFILFVIIQADKNYNAMLYTHMWCNLRAYRRARTFLSFVIAHGEVGNLMSRCTVVVFRNDYIDWINFYCMSVRRCFDLFSEECQVQVSTCAPLHWSCARLLVRNSKKIWHAAQTISSCYLMGLYCVHKKCQACFLSSWVFPLAV